MQLQTDRLLIRPWKESDFPALSLFFRDPIASEHVGGVKSKEEAWRLMATYLGHLQLKGYSYYAVTSLDKGELLGSVGLWNSEPWPELELGYWFLPSHQGKGFAYEAASALKEYAFKKLNIDTLVSYISEKNKPSQQLSTKLGGYEDGTIELLQFGQHKIYRYDKNK